MILTDTDSHSSVQLCSPRARLLSSLSIQTSGQQTLSVSVTLPATAADLLSPEDRITASLVNKQKSLSHDKIAEFETLYKAARFDVSLRKRKRKDYLPPGKDRYDLTSPPMMHLMQAMREMAERADIKSSKKKKVSKKSTVTSTFHDDDEATFSDELTPSRRELEPKL